MNIQSFGLGTTGRWVRLGKGVLGRVMPFAICVVVLEALFGGALAWRNSEGLLGFAYVSLFVDFSIFSIAIWWAHIHPNQAASEGADIAQIIRANAFASKSIIPKQTYENVPGPHDSLEQTSANKIGSIATEARGHLMEQYSGSPVLLGSNRGSRE